MRAEGSDPEFQLRFPHVRWRTDGRGPRRQHDTMEPSRTPLTAIYTEWLRAWRSMFASTPPADPAQDPTPAAAQAEAEQEWEHEGGSIKQAKKPGSAE